MNTSVEIEDELMDAARKITGLQSDHEIIQVALRELVRLHGQAQIRELRGKVEWEGDLEESRTSRFLED